MWWQCFYRGLWRCLEATCRQNHGEIASELQRLNLHLVSLWVGHNRVPPAVPDKHQQCSHSGPLVSFRHFSGSFTSILPPRYIFNRESQDMKYKQPQRWEWLMFSCRGNHRLHYSHSCIPVAVIRSPLAGRRVQTFRHLFWTHLAKVDLISRTSQK